MKGNQISENCCPPEHGCLGLNGFNPHALRPRYPCSGGQLENTDNLDETDPLNPRDLCSGGQLENTDTLDETDPLNPRDLCFAGQLENTDTLD